jgi:type VI protein secretion system component Hcp
MAFDIFMTFLSDSDTGVKLVGPSTDKAHRNAFDIRHVEWGATNPHNLGIGSGGAGAGKTAFKLLHIQKLVDGTSPLWFEALATGTHFDKVTLAFRKAGTGGGPSAAGGAEFLVLTLHLVFIVASSTVGSPADELPVETWDIAYGAMEVTASNFTPTGAVSTTLTRGWNQITNDNDPATPPGF